MKSFAIIPAAGRSERMGQQKLLMPWDDSTVIERVVAAWNASHVSRVVVVVRPDDDDLASVCRSSGVDVVVPSSAPPEMKDSVSLGVEYVERNLSPSPSDVWLLAPADAPRLSTAVIDRLLDENDAEQPAILVPTIGGKHGHPVLFPWSLAGKVRTLAADQGVNQLLKRNPVREVDVDDATILDDLDTPDDYRRMQDPHDA